LISAAVAAVSAVALFHQLLAGFGDRALVHARVTGDSDLTYLRFTSPAHTTGIRLSG